MSSKPMREQVEEYIVHLQDTIVTALEKLDPNSATFKRDSWVRPQGGRGQSCVFAVSEAAESVSPDAATTVLEKAGVNISVSTLR